MECEPAGYFIYHPESGICIEYSPTAPSPYLGIDGEIVYGGPTYYYHESIDNEYVHTIKKEETVSEEMVFAFIKSCNETVMNLNADKIEFNVAIIEDRVEEYLNSMISSDSIYAPLSVDYTNYWVTRYGYFTITARENFGYYNPDGSNGICGYVAANLIFKYWHDRGSITLDSQYQSGTALTEVLYNQGVALGYPDGSWASPISSVMNVFCQVNYFPKKATWTIFDYGVADEIKTFGRPSILFGNIPNVRNPSEKINHAIVAYGYNTYENPGHTTYVCHFGWDKFNIVHVSGSTATFGSTTKYQI